MENSLLKVLVDTKYYTFHNFKRNYFIINRNIGKRCDYVKGLIVYLERFINENDSLFGFVDQYKKVTSNVDFMIQPSQVSFFGFFFYKHQEGDNINLIFPYIVTNDDKYIVYRKIVLN